MTDTSLFETTPTTSKYDNWDVDALKNKAISADNHINTLQSELAELRNSKTSDAKMEELLNRLTEISTPPQNTASNVVNHTTERVPGAPVVTTEDIETLVSKSLEKKQKEDLSKQNVAKLHRELKAAWGDNYRSIMTNKAQELGINQNFLASLAETHPDALLKLVLDKPKSSDLNTHVAPPSVLNTRAGQVQLGTTYKEFSKAMKDNPSLRSDPNFIARMHEAAERHGEAFYN